MNATVFQKNDHFMLATGGRLGNCVLYKIKFKIEDDSKMHCNDDKENILNNYPNGSIRRRSISGKSLNGNALRDDPIKPSLPTLDKDQQTNLTFDITRVTDFQADFDQVKEPYLKVVKYSPNSNLVITGGSDGSIRLFGYYPILNLIIVIPAHKDEITSLSIDSTSSRLISISRDRHVYIWNLKKLEELGKLREHQKQKELNSKELNSSKLKELKLNLNNRLNGKLIDYDFRDCSFATDPIDSKRNLLYTVHNPFIRTRPPCKSLICKWNTKSFEPDQMVYAGLEPFSEITIRFVLK